MHFVLFQELMRASRADGKLELHLLVLVQEMLDLLDVGLRRAIVVDDLV